MVTCALRTHASSLGGLEGGRPSHVICTAYRRCQTSDDGGEISNCNRGRHEPRTSREPRAARWHSKVMPPPPISNMYSAKKTTREANCARGGGRPAGGAGEGQLQNRLLTWNRFRDIALYRRTHTAKLQYIIHLSKGDNLSILSEIEIRRWQIISWFKLVPSRWPSIASKFSLPRKCAGLARCRNQTHKIAGIKGKIAAVEHGEFRKT